MAGVNIPTTQEIKDRNLANFENKLSQTSPLADKAFLRVLSAAEAMGETGLYKFGAERAVQALVLTATGTDLELLGRNYGVIKKNAESAQLEISLPGTPGTLIPATASFIGDSNGVRYFPDASATVGAGGTATINVTAQDVGVVGNLNNGETMTIDTQIPGAETVATVTDTLNTGIDEETDDAYRIRILDEVQTVGGGGNAADYRTWAQETGGIIRAYPYSGGPVFSAEFLVDGDMEAVGVADWTAGNSATLTKQTTNPYAGAQVLRVAYNAVNDPYASQTALSNDLTYRLTGYARSDGTGVPKVEHPVSTILWTGTTSTSWQFFDITFTSSLTSQVLAFKTVISGAGYCEFDQVSLAESLPGDRTVYGEADPTVNPDGICSAALLDEMRASINADPVTGQTRPPLGLVDDRLFCLSINRRELVTEIDNLTINSGQIADAQTDIDAALDEYYRSLRPFIDGLDAAASRNDVITNLTVSEIVQDVLTSYGGSADRVRFGLNVGQYIDSYQLNAGELARAGTVTYV